MKLEFPQTSKAFDEAVEVSERYDPGDIKTTLNDALKEIMKKDLEFKLIHSWDNLYLLVGYIGTLTLCLTTAWAFDKDFWYAKEYLAYSLGVYILYCLYSLVYALPKDYAVAFVGLKSGKLVAAFSQFGITTDFKYRYHFYTLREDGTYHPYKNKGELMYTTEFSVGDVISEKGKLSAAAFLQVLNNSKSTKLKGE